MIHTERQIKTRPLWTLIWPYYVSIAAITYKILYCRGRLGNVRPPYSFVKRGICHAQQKVLICFGRVDISFYYDFCGFPADIHLLRIEFLSLPSGMQCIKHYRNVNIQNSCAEVIPARPRRTGGKYTIIPIPPRGKILVMVFQGRWWDMAFRHSVLKASSCW